MKTVLHIDLDEDNLDLTIRELIMSKLKKPDESQSALPSSETTTKKYNCNNPTCKKEVTKAIVTFCLNNKDRFKGKVYCIECQKNY